MSVHDAELGDIYVDEQGKLWRVIALTREPVVEVEEVEGRAYNPQSHAYAQQLSCVPSSAEVPIIRDRKSGGVSGFMWKGFKRIWRKS